MNQQIKKTLYIVLALISVLSCTIGIISSFVFSDNIQKMLNFILKIKVYEPFVGGKIITSIFDPLYDDIGPGVLEYPANAFFSEGNLDLVMYTVHEPVYHAQWQEVPEYWQLDLEFRTGFKDVQNPDYNKTIYIYIAIDNEINGSIKTLFDQGENISFDENYYWNYALAVTSNEGYVYNAQGEKIDVLETVYSIDGKNLMIRIPLTRKELQKIYTAQKTYHYVLVCAYSSLDYAKILPIEKRRSRTSGGGLQHSLMPKVYDLLYDGDHKAMLSSWDEENFELSKISPVSVSMKHNESSNVSVSEEKINTIQQEIQVLSQKQNETQNKRYEQLKKIDGLSEKEQEELALIAFENGDKEEAEKIFSLLLTKQPNNPTYIAYKGSLESMKGANASVFAAVEAVNKGYSYLDKAVLLTEGTLEKVKSGKATEEEIAHRYSALLNRGGNSQAVPNSVFLKAAQGANDYLEVAEIARLTNNTLLEAQCYYDTAVCFSLDDKINNALIWKKEAARKIKELNISLEKEKSFSVQDSLKILVLRLKLLSEGLGE